MFTRSPKEVWHRSRLFWLIIHKMAPGVDKIDWNGR